nr:hypothetical protein [Ardenticatenales bacterium]
DGGRAIRHARVTVWPQVVEGDHLLLPLSELQMESNTVSEKGRFLKRLRSHVRVSHSPTGQHLECTSALPLHESEALALELLRAALLAQRYDLAIAPSTPPWGDVVRSYQRHKEQGVRDLRTDTVIKSLRHVLSGRIDPFLMAALIQRSRG